MLIKINKFICKIADNFVYFFTFEAAVSRRPPSGPCPALKYIRQDGKRCHLLLSFRQKAFYLVNSVCYKVKILNKTENRPRAFGKRFVFFTFEAGVSQHPPSGRYPALKYIRQDGKRCPLLLSLRQKAFYSANSVLYKIKILNL